MPIVQTLRGIGQIVAVALTAGIFVATGHLFAQTATAPGNPEAGRTLALTFCAGCHQVEPAAVGPVNADIPTFVSIARRPDTTEDRIVTFITDPHPPMPRLDLNRQQIADLVSFILSHRDRAPDG